MNCILQFKGTSGRKHWLVTKGRTQNSLWPEYVIVIIIQTTFFFLPGIYSHQENLIMQLVYQCTSPVKEYLAKYCFLIVHWAKVWGPGNLKRERALSRRFTNDFTTITCHQATISKVHSSQIQTKWSWHLCTMKVKVLLLELYAFPLCIVLQGLRKIGFARISCKCWNQSKCGPLSAAGGEIRPLTVTDNRNITTRLLCRTHHCKPTNHIAEWNFIVDLRPYWAFSFQACTYRIRQFAFVPLQESVFEASICKVVSSNITKNRKCAFSSKDVRFVVSISFPLIRFTDLSVIWKES